MIDLKKETLISINEGCRVLPGNPSLPTLWRWRFKGVKGRKLESVTIGGKVFTSMEALERFAQHRGGSAEPATIRTPAARERAIRKAEQELAEAGI